MCEKEPQYNEQILPDPWTFVKSRFHCTSFHHVSWRSVGGVKLSSKVGKQNTEFFKQDQELQVTFNIIYVPKNDFFLLIFPNIRIEVAS